MRGPDSATTASVAEQPIAEELLSEIDEKHSVLLERCEYFTGDKGYDTVHLNEKLYDDFEIKPMIDIRNLWKDIDKTKLVPGTENVVYNYKGEVSCVCPVTLTERQMAFGGFEKYRNTLKYICPVQAYGISCAGCAKCPLKKSVRVNIDIGRRIFTPLARTSHAWKKVYAVRTAVERVNSRIDVSFGTSKHYIRGLKKMKVRCGLALCIMLTMAYGRIMEDQQDLMRSFVKVAS